jgi:D-tyrosyl-tRNA(Tyr) deacylase
MRVVLQRVSEASVSVDGTEIARIGPGVCLLLGVADDDTEADADYLAQKVPEIRIFEDDQGKMNRSLQDSKGEVLVVSEFTLYGNCAKGRRPSFSRAAGPEKAEALYRHFLNRLAGTGLKVAAGKFRAKMQVNLSNDGPVTLIVDSK